MYVPITRNIISSYDVVFDESFSSALAYTSRPYSEAMAMRPVVTYTPYVTSSREQTGDIITFAQFETNALNMRHQAQKGFCGIFVGIPEHQKGYIVYVPSTRKIIYSYDVVFDENVLVSYHIRHNLI